MITTTTKTETTSTTTTDITKVGSVHIKRYAFMYEGASLEGLKAEQAMCIEKMSQNISLEVMLEIAATLYVINEEMAKHDQ